MTSIYKQLAVAATGTVLSLAMIPAGEALAAAIPSSESRYGQILENAERGDGFTAGDLTLTRTGGSEEAQTVGNGVDESINWTFDFTEDEALLEAFLNEDGPLASAEIVFLRMGITDSRFTTDWFGIPGWGGQRFGFGSEITPEGHKLIRVPSIPDIPGLGEIGDVAIDLLANGFTSDDILNTFFDDTTHTNPWYNFRADGDLSRGHWQGDISDYEIYNAEYAIPFIYMDDAIIPGVELRLTRGDVTITSTVSATEEPISVPEPGAIAALAVLGGSLLLNNKKRQA